MNRSLKDMQKDLMSMVDSNRNLHAARNRSSRKDCQQKYNVALASIRKDLKDEIAKTDVLFNTENAAELIRYIKRYLSAKKLEIDLNV